MTDGQHSDDVLAALRDLRAQDPPTHGGSVLSYVYDSGRAQLDEIAGRAAQLFQSVNGLDPTTFTSVATLERDLVAFGRRVLGGDHDVVGSVTSGGTESCLLAVRSARERTRGRGGDDPVMVVPTSAHPAFRKASDYLSVPIVPVPVDPDTAAVQASAMLDAVDRTVAEGRDVALVVASAPSYPAGVMDPVAEIAAGCLERGVDLHVDACLGGFVLPWWPAEIPVWDFRVPGVTSVSADLHKYGYAPKGVSLLLHRGRDRHRAQYFATSSWPGYPVVNPTALGSRSATSMAAAWAIVWTLGERGYRDLTAQVATAAADLRAALDGVTGLRLLGDPVGPLLAIVADDAAASVDRVDPFLLVDAVRRRGFLLQAQPAYVQPDGTVLPRSAHATLTPVSTTVIGDLVRAMTDAADEVRGAPAPEPDPELVARVAQEGLPADLAAVMATLESLPPEQAPPLLAGLLAATVDPDRFQP